MRGQIEGTPFRFNKHSQLREWDQVDRVAGLRCPESVMATKTKTSFYRRLYVAYLIHTGINTVPAIVRVSGMPRRTAQDTISALGEIDILCRFEGAKKDGGVMLWYCRTR